MRTPKNIRELTLLTALTAAAHLLVSTTKIVFKRQLNAFAKSLLSVQETAAAPSAFAVLPHFPSATWNKNRLLESDP